MYLCLSLIRFLSHEEFLIDDRNNGLVELRALHTFARWHISPSRPLWPISILAQLVLTVLSRDAYA